MMSFQIKTYFIKSYVISNDFCKIICQIDHIKSLIISNDKSYQIDKNLFLSKIFFKISKFSSSNLNINDKDK